MAAALQVHHRKGRIAAQAAGAAGKAHHAQGGLATGIDRRRLHHGGGRIALHLAHQRQPAVHEPVMGLAVVGQVIHHHPLAPQAHAVLRIRTHGARHPPAHGAVREPFQGSIGKQPAHQRKHRRRFGEERILQHATAATHHAKGIVDVAIAIVEIGEAKARPVAARMHDGGALQHGRELGTHQVAAHLT